MSAEERSRKQIILDTIDDAVSNLLYYDRKEDEDLPSGEIEAAVEAKEISIDEMVAAFATAIAKVLG